MSTDGRDTRWAEHRKTRRTELVEHALRAIREHGPSVGMEEIAAQAGTSKTVIYRHFTDRAGLYAAIVDTVHEYIHHDLTAALQLSNPEDLGKLAGDLTDAYLGLVERDTSVYRFVMSHPSPAQDGLLDPAGALPTIIGSHLEQTIAVQLAGTGLDPAIASTWGTGLVGFVRAVADRWIASEPRADRSVLVAHVSALFASALTGEAAPRSIAAGSERPAGKWRES